MVDELLHWEQAGQSAEHRLCDTTGAILGRIIRRGCCWYASIGNQPASAARFSRIDDAKRIVEKLVGN